MTGPLSKAVAARHGRVARGEGEVIANTMKPKYDVVVGSLIASGMSGDEAARVLDGLLDDVADVEAAGGDWRDALLGVPAEASLGGWPW